jgi:hypothetical protein
MKVLDLHCTHGHCFEGWFGSQEDYDAQRARGLVTCPVCNDSGIVKRLSAPRLNLGHGTAPAGPKVQEGTSPVAGHEPSAAAEAAHGARIQSPHVQSPHLAVPPTALQQMQAAMLSMVRHVMAHTEDVGPRFAEEARKIHYGECEERSIRGQATAQEAHALQEEGIDVLPLPLPPSLKGPLQ